ncbi:MAG: hypothetical protein ACOZDY_21045 [Pseudomonadota bacterium]
MALLAGFVAAYPVNWWLVSKGLKHGMMTVRDDGAADGGLPAHGQTGRGNAHGGWAGSASAPATAIVTLISSRPSAPASRWPRSGARQERARHDADRRPRCAVPGSAHRRPGIGVDLPRVRRPQSSGPLERPHRITLALPSSTDQGVPHETAFPARFGCSRPHRCCHRCLCRPG